MDVEKTYWALKGSGKFDLETFEQHVSPPLPQELIPGMYICKQSADSSHLMAIPLLHVHVHVRVCACVLRIMCVYNVLCMQVCSVSWIPTVMVTWICQRW